MTNLNNELVSRIIRIGDRPTYVEKPDVYSDGTPKMSFNKETGRLHQATIRKPISTLASAMLEAALKKQ